MLDERKAIVTSIKWPPEGGRNGKGLPYNRLRVVRLQDCGMTKLRNLLQELLYFLGLECQCPADITSEVHHRLVVHLTIRFHEPGLEGHKDVFHSSLSDLSE
jgi:hypothetical protein